MLNNDSGLLLHTQPGNRSLYGIFNNTTIIKLAHIVFADIAGRPALYAHLLRVQLLRYFNFGVNKIRD